MTYHIVFCVSKSVSFVDDDIQGLKVGWFIPIAPRWSIGHL
jgi:hypothetical protein